MPEYPQEGVLRGGHIPGAKSVPWKRAVNDDGTFKSVGDLSQIYTQACGLHPGEDIIAYCSTFTDLVPGDVIVSGTPGGVGAARNPPLFMKAGDVIDVEVKPIGVLRNRVVVG